MRTNRVSIVNLIGDSVSVVNGTTDRVIATVTLPNSNGGGSVPAVDVRTNRIYAAGAPGSLTWVIDGETNAVSADLPGGGDSTQSIAVNLRL